MEVVSASGNGRNGSACRRKRSVPLSLFSTEQTGTVCLRPPRGLSHHQRRHVALLACRRKRSVPLCLFSTEQTGTVRLRPHAGFLTINAGTLPFWRVGVSEASRFASSVRSKPGRFAYAGTSTKSRGGEKRFPVLLVISFCRVWLSAVRSEKTGHWVPGIVLYPNADNSRMTTDTDNW